MVLPRASSPWEASLLLWTGSVSGRIAVYTVCLEDSSVPRNVDSASGAYCASAAQLQWPSTLMEEAPMQGLETQESSRMPRHNHSLRSGLEPLLAGAKCGVRLLICPRLLVKPTNALGRSSSRTCNAHERDNVYHYQSMLEIGYHSRFREPRIYQRFVIAFALSLHG